MFIKPNPRSHQTNRNEFLTRAGIHSLKSLQKLHRSCITRIPHGILDNFTPRPTEQTMRSARRDPAYDGHQLVYARFLLGTQLANGRAPQQIPLCTYA